MREIPLANGKGVALVDDEDYERVATHRWTLHSRGYASFAKWQSGRSVAVLMHRLISGAQPGQVVDHINHDPLDNRRENLRVCTAGENMYNRRKLATATSRFRGVYRKGGRWIAHGQIDRRRQLLGSYATEAEAAHAFDAFARAHYGPHAAVNFPESGEQGTLPENRAAGIAA